MRTTATTVTLSALTALAPLSNAGELHSVDFIIAVQNDQLITGAVNLGTGEADYPVRIKTASFGAEGIPNFTNDPGFNSELGALPPGLEVGFSILSAPRVWDDTTQDFETIASETLTVRASGQNFQAPSTDTRLDAIVFGQANNDAGASFHHHLQYLLNSAIPPAVDGLWLLELELWTTDSSIAPSEPIYIVFAQGTAAADQAIAVEWVEDNRIADACPADLTGDGALDFFDLSAYLTAFGNSDPSADLTGDGAWDFFDLSAYLTLFGQGCP